MGIFQLRRTSARLLAMSPPHHAHHCGAATWVPLGRVVRRDGGLMDFQGSEGSASWCIMPAASMTPQCSVRAPLSMRK